MNAQGIVIAHHCQGCGEQHDTSDLFSGHRYRVADRWLCVTCMLTDQWVRRHYAL